MKSSSSYSAGCSHHNNNNSITNNSRNKSTSMLSLFSTKSFSAKKTAKKIQSQSANSYGSYSNLFSAASYGSMCSLDNAGKKQKKRYWIMKVWVWIRIRFNQRLSQKLDVGESLMEPWYFYVAYGVTWILFLLCWYNNIDWWEIWNVPDKG